MFKKLKNKRYFVYLIFFITPLLNLNVCSQPTEVDEEGHGIIIPGVSVEGIKLGDSEVGIGLGLYGNLNLM